MLYDIIPKVGWNQEKESESRGWLIQNDME
jgi:hypothetical protein